MFRVIELQPEGQLSHGGVEFTFRNCKRGGVVRAGIVSISSEEGAVKRIVAVACAVPGRGLLFGQGTKLMPRPEGNIRIECCTSVV